MKTKKLFTLAALLTSSLASAVDLAELENKYYVGLNFGGEYSGGLNLRPNLLIGYHYKKSSKLELEINSNIHSLENIGVGLLANYRYYPDIDLGPVTLYVSGGLGSYIQIIGEASSGGNADKSAISSKGDEEPSTSSTGGEDEVNEISQEDNDEEPEEKRAREAIKKIIKDHGNQEAHKHFVKNTDGSQQRKLEALIEQLGIEGAKVIPTIAKHSPAEYSNQVTTNQPSANKILGYIAYKLKIGVDYKFTPRVIGAVGFNLVGSLNSLTQVGTGIEVGIRYNF